MNIREFLHTNWRWLFAGFLLTFASSFGQTFFISVFAGEIMQAFDLSHRDWGTAYMIGTLASAVVMIWTGALTDIFRVRSLSLVVLAGLSLACFAMALVPGSWVLVVVIFALRLAGQGMASHIATVAMARWYVAARGKALSIASLGYAVGEVLMPIIFAALIALIGWRLSWVVAALMVICILPAIIILLREERTPRSTIKTTEAVGMAGLHWSRKAVLKHWLFWLILPLLLGPATFGTAFFFQQVHIAEMKGWSHASFVALFPVYTVTGIGTMMISGLFIDRFGTAPLFPIFQLPMALGFYVFGSTDTMNGAVIGMACLGLSSGFNATLPAAFWAEFFGTRFLGGVKAMATAVMVLGSAIGPGLTGTLIDLGIPFTDQMFGISLYFVIAACLTGVGVFKAYTLLPRFA